MGEPANALTLEWAFGFSRSGGVHSLCDEHRSALFYSSSHTGVIYDLVSRTQLLLQGHCNAISATAASEDRTRLVSADAGPDSMIVLWDSYSAKPIKSIHSPHPHGVATLDLTPDARYLATLSAGPGPQVLSVWDLEAGGDAPLFSAQVGTEEEPVETQTSVRFKPDDPTELVTNGTSLVIFWSFVGGELAHYAPPPAAGVLKQRVGALTTTLFLPGSDRAISMTADGDSVLWGKVATLELPEMEVSERRAIKLVKLHSAAIQCATVIGNLLVTGGAEGHVRIFTHDLRVVAWFEELDAGPITDISFAYDPQIFASPPDKIDGLRCPDFVVGTSHSLIVACTASMFDEFSPEARRGTLLVQGQDAAVHGLAAHPKLPRFASTGHSGLLQLWDYEEKRMLLLRMFDSLYGHCLAFSPDGELLVIGFTNGLVKVLSADTLQDLITFSEARGCVQHLTFSADGDWLAVAAADRAVALYRYGPGAADPTAREWEFVGRHKAHSAPISSLAFSSGVGGAARLLSCGDDRFLVEYDLSRASVQDGFPLKKATRLEQTATPSALLWLDAPGSQPGSPQESSSASSSPPMVAVANDAYKLRLVSVDTMVTSKTVLGPTHGGPVTRMLRLPIDPEITHSATEREGKAKDEKAGEEAVRAASDVCGTKLAADGYAVYTTYEKVIGLVRLPFDGNPNNGMGLIAHPGELSSIAVTADGGWVITAGGSDLSIHMWAVDTSALDATAAAGGAGAVPFERMLDGGREGAFYSEMADYFCYAQLRAQGEDAVEERRVPGRVPAAELSNLMRAIGYYPTDREIDDMVQEVTAGGATDVDFDDFLKLYINHRPVVGVTPSQIADAFRVLAATYGGAGKEGSANGSQEPLLSRSALVRALKAHGEALGPADLALCLQALVGVSDVEDVLSDKVDAKEFAEKLLGFEGFGEGVETAV